MTPNDLSYILKQIKIAEQHAATFSAAAPCSTLLGTGPDQIPSPLLSRGLRTVDGSCNNLQPGQERFGSADQPFPRLTTPVFQDADPVPTGFGPPGPSSYQQKTGNVFDSEPRTVSNLIVDQTATNPAAVAAAGSPVRTQGNKGVVPCDSAGKPADCVPAGQTLFMPNVTTDVGLSPPYNSLFTIFGQFFDHGVDQTVKSGGTVFVPLKADDPLIPGPDHVLGTADDLPANQRFMVLTRAQNQPGPDGVLGTADDIQNANNTDSPWVDQSQTYTSHPSHQVFLREYVANTAGRPVATGSLLGGPAGPQAGGISTWTTVKAQGATLLGIHLVDMDVLNIPMLATDPYGKFIPGPLRGLPQFVLTNGSTVEADRAGGGTLVPANVRHFDTPFLTDIAHNADPSPQDTDHNPATPPVAPTPDADSTPSADFAKQAPGTYDDEMLNAHFICGDGRCNENIALSAVHQIFHSEHDRLVGHIKTVLTNDTSTTGTAALPAWKLALGADGWNGERLFQAARFVTEMEYQHLVFEEFARKVQPAINPFQPFAFTQTELNPAIKAEFAHAVYRFGHSMLTETISRTNADGSNNDIPLLDGFLNPPSYTQRTAGGASGVLTSEQAAGSIFMGMSDQTGNELDEFVTDTLRNNLLGLPLDLPTINMTRARSEGVPPLNLLRRQLFASTNDSQLKPYANWIDFGQALKHPESLVNFVAAYGQHPTITAQTTVAGKRAAATLIVDPPAGATPPADAGDFMGSTGAFANVGTVSKTGLDKIDLWVGGLAEKTNLFGGLLGSTFNYVFENQLTDLQNGDRLYYLARTPGMNLRTQLEGNSFAELVMRNTNAHSLKADAFGTADRKFCLTNLGTSGPIPDDRYTTAYNESDLLLRMPDGTIRYRERNSVDPAGINGQSVYVGTPGVDRIWGGVDNDTFLGGDGNDIIEGNDGADIALGGEGNDIITDSAGDDVPKGGPGNDAIDAGPGADIVMGGDGKDFTNGGANINETFAGEGDDFVIAGQGEDAVFGDSGDDWEEGGDQPDLLQGDSGNLFFQDDTNKAGNDILLGQGGDDDYDMEGGDDIGVAGPGVEKVAGASGFDWEIGQLDPQPQDADLALPLVGLDVLVVGVRDRYNEVEALSGGKLDDKLRGQDVAPKDITGGGFIGNDVLTQAGVDRIPGLETLLPAGATAAGATWGEGNILLGGPGNDLLEGRGANDILDGDAWLKVQLRSPDLTTTDPTDAKLVDGMTVDPDGSGPQHSLQEDVFAGRMDPGDITAVRSIETTGAAGGDVDTAVFSGLQAAYTVTTTGGVTAVEHTGGGADGIDTLRNIEQLTFQAGTPTDTTDDVTITLSTPTPTPSPIAAPAVGTITPAVAPAPTTPEPTCEMLLPQTAAPVVAPTPVPVSGSVPPLVVPAVNTPAGTGSGAAAPATTTRASITSTLTRSAVNVRTKVTLTGKVAPFRGATLTLKRKVGAGPWRAAARKVFPTRATSGAYAFALPTARSGVTSYAVTVNGPGIDSTVGARRTLSVYRAAVGAVVPSGAEHVAIRNTGTVSVNLAGWRLRDASGKTLTLTRYVLRPGRTVQAYTGTGARAAGNLRLATAADLWSRHDTVRLFDRNGALVATRRY